MDNYQNPDNQFRNVNNRQMQQQGASSLSVNAPEFVPGTGGMPPMGMCPGPGYGNVLQDWTGPNPHAMQQPHFNQPQQFPYTPYAPQQPIPDLVQNRMSGLSISNRLNRYNHPGQITMMANHQPMTNGLPTAGGFGGGPPQHVANGRRPRGGGNQYHKSHHQAQQHHAAANQQNDEYEDASHQPTETEDQALNYLSEVMHKVENDPGMFDHYQKRLREIFYELSNNQFVVSNAVELLFTQSIKVQNFRYMGARICRLLDDLESSENSYFRNLLRMKMDYEKKEIANCSADQHRVRGTTLFLAELYTQLRRPNDSYRNIEIADSIQYAINLLLQKATPENLKCVCQTLKLCGFELDLDCAEKMDNIMMTLNEKQTVTDTSTVRLIQNVLELRTKRWGRTETFNTPEVISNQEYNDGPVFYGPDGKVLTEEEYSFQASNLPDQHLVEDLVGSDSGEDLVDEEYDLEVQLAFKEFLQQNKAATANAATNNSTSTGNKQN